MDKICWLFFLYENFKIMFQKYPETARPVGKGVVKKWNFFRFSQFNIIKNNLKIIAFLLCQLKKIFIRVLYIQKEH